MYVDMKVGIISMQRVVNCGSCMPKERLFYVSKKAFQISLRVIMKRMVY